MGEEKKSVCADCFVKQDAKSIIAQKGEIGKCDYCGNENVKVMSVDDIVNALYIEHFNNLKQNMNLPCDKGGEFVNSRVWYSKGIDLDRYPISKRFVDSLTEIPELRTDLLLSLLYTKE